MKTHLSNMSPSPELSEVKVKWWSFQRYIPSGYPLLLCLMSECLPAPGAGIFVPRFHQWWCGSRGKLHPLPPPAWKQVHTLICPLVIQKASPPPIEKLFFFFSLELHKQPRVLTTRCDHLCCLNSGNSDNMANNGCGHYNGARLFFVNQLHTIWQNL